MAVKVATVFGGSGFVGRYVVRELARAGVQVRVAVRNPESALFLKPMGEVGQIAPIQANVRNDASVAGAVRGSDTVINLVGVLYEQGRQRFDAIHAQGAGRIARAAAAASTAGCQTSVAVTFAPTSSRCGALNRGAPWRVAVSVSRTTMELLIEWARSVISGGGRRSPGGCGASQGR